jgi:hypothetical protein
MEGGMMAWTVSGVSGEVPKVAKGAEVEVVQRSADQARVSGSIMCGMGGVGEERSRRVALLLLDMDKRLLPDMERAPISLSLWLLRLQRWPWLFEVLTRSRRTERLR